MELTNEAADLKVLYDKVQDKKTIDDFLNKLLIAERQAKTIVYIEMPNAPAVYLFETHDAVYINTCANVSNAN